MNILYSLCIYPFVRYLSGKARRMRVIYLFIHRKKCLLLELHTCLLLHGLLHCYTFFEKCNMNFENGLKSRFSCYTFFSKVQQDFGLDCALCINIYDYLLFYYALCLIGLFLGNLNPIRKVS